MAARKEAPKKRKIKPDDLREKSSDRKNLTMGGKWLMIALLMSPIIGCSYSFLFNNNNNVDPYTVENSYNMAQLVEKHPNYTLTEYTAKTRDGYILRIYRLNSKNVPVSVKSPVFLQHGVCLSSEEFVRMGPERSLGYLLADAGYDVWIGNYRGNPYTSHETIPKTDKRFWDYSYVEHGMEDLPAMLNTAMQVSGAQRIHYIGFSMGGSGYMIMCDTRPEMRDKIVSFIGLAAAPTLNLNFAPIINLLFKANFFNLLRNVGFDPIAAPEDLWRFFTNTFCNGRAKINICNQVAGILVGRDDEQIDPEKIASTFGRLTPLSVKTFEHFSQGIVSGRLRKFDYGRERNLQRYGVDFPPLYNVSTMIAPSAFFYGKNDQLVPAAVGILVADELSKTNPVVIQKYIAWDKFTHLDFMNAKDLKGLANDDVVRQQIEFTRQFDL